MNHVRRDTNDEALPLKKSPSIQNEASSRSNPFFDENKTTKSSFLYPHGHQQTDSNSTTTATSLSSSNQIKNLTTPFSNFSRSELNVSTPMSTRPEEKYPDADNSYFESTTPSMLSRSLFIQQEQLQPVQTSTLRIRRALDIDEPDNSFSSGKFQDSSLFSLSINKIEEKYSILGQNNNSVKQAEAKTTNVESNSKKIADVNDDDFPLNCRVIVNTDHQIFNKPGTVRYVGKTYFKEGTWYGIELEEPVGQCQSNKCSKRKPSNSICIVFREKQRFLRWTFVFHLSRQTWSFRSTR